MVDEEKGGNGGEKPIEEQAREQTGQRQVRIQMDQSKMTVGYANMVATNATAEEVVLDFGLNLMQPGQTQQGPVQMVFQVSERVVLNYYSAKRLALALGQAVRRHEEQFGQIELDVTQRRKAR